MSPVSQSRSRSRAQRTSTPYPAGPFRGLRDSLDPTVSNNPEFATVLENVYPIELNKPSIFVGRPGFLQMGLQGGAANKRAGQRGAQFTKDDGTEYTFRIIGGQGIQTYNWGTDLWTTVVSVANLTTASITLSETAKVFTLTFANKLLVNDGVNKMWTWDGTAGAGGLVSLTNAPVIYGQPTLYYAKVVGIKATERNVIVWSEEQDATIGWEMAAYNNTWALIQSDQGQLFTITGTNEALYYQRSHSSARILGAVTSDFKADGTRAGVDEKIGCESPAGILFKNARGFFVDARARPHVLVPGGQVKEVWQDIHETLMGVDVSATELAKSIVLYDERLQLVLFCVTEIGQSNPSMVIVFNPILDLPVAVWRGFTFQDIAVVKDADGTPTLMHLSDDGYSYAHGLPEGATFSDALNASTNAIRHVVVGPYMGTSTDTEKTFSRADVLLRADANASSITASYETPYGTSDSQSASVSGSSSRWDDDSSDAEWDDDTSVWSTNTVERHVAFGLATVARWLKFRVAHEVLGEQFGFAKMTVRAEAAGTTPNAL